MLRGLVIVGTVEQVRQILRELMELQFIGCEATLTEIATFHMAKRV
jgi:hypothetical protein